MKRWVRWTVLAVSTAAILVLFLVLQPGGDGDGLSPSPTDSPSPSESASVSPSPIPNPSPEPERTLVEVTVREGNVEGPARRTVRQGDEVRILVHADVSDHVHLHGYDLMDDVTPDQPARIDFVARAAGVYEVELEDAGTLLFQLEITP